MKRFVFIFVILFSILFIKSVQADSYYAAHTNVELMSDVKTIQPGRLMRLAVRMTMDDGWHVYWKNPGDSGLAPQVKWNLSDGIEAGEIHWPAPRRIVAGPLTTFGYEGEVYFIVDVHVPAKLPLHKTINLTANVEWLACQIDCIPGRAQLQLSLPVKANEPEIDEEAVENFLSVSKTWPITSKDWRVRIISRAKDFLLIMTSSSDDRPIKDLYFYPERGDLINHASAQKLKSVRNGAELIVFKSNIFPAQGPASVGGILVRSDGWLPSGEAQAIVIDVPLENEFVSADRKTMNVLLACAFAFLGGLILNLMPCVLPVLSLKILSLLKHSANRRSMLFHGLFFTLGVLVSFWILAALLIVLKAFGQEIGWGFQFQSPYFVVFMAALLCVLALNLFGLFEIGMLLSSSAHPSNKGYRGSFWGGVLATVLATPCTAPFMGTALGFALTQNALTALLIFTFLGIGMALPYLFLSVFPQFLKWVPKPGMWISQLKIFLGFVLLASVVWLVWVLGLQKGIHSIGLFMSGVLLLSLGCWIVGLIQNEQAAWRSISVMLFALACGIFLIFSAAWLPGQLSGQSVQKNSQGIDWQDFSPEIVEDLITQKKAVFIDFTAAWCLTCQVNDRLVFGDSKVQSAFKQLNITAIKADWTNQDQLITQALAGYGKNSIPLYVFYAAGSNRPVVLPELITPGIIIEALVKEVEKH